MRKTLTVIIVAILLFISLMAVYSIRVYQERMPKTDDCDLLVGSYNIQTVPKEEGKLLDCVCAKTGISQAFNDDYAKEHCKKFRDDYVLRILVSCFASIAILFINKALKITMKKMSSFEKYDSISREKRSYMGKLFVLTFINMGLLILLINANFQDFVVVKGITSILPPFFSDIFFNGPYADTTRDWYTSVGVAIILLVMTTTISNISATYGMAVAVKCKMCCCKKKAVL